MKISLDGWKPVMAMVLAQTGYAWMTIFNKLAADDGMNMRILVAYCFMFATAFTVPLALILERRSRPKLTWMVLFQASLCGLFGGSLAQNLYVESLYLTTATFASAMVNLIPGVTFILTLFFGLEKLALTLPGMAKVVGTLVGVGGAMVFTFYGGAEIESPHIDLLQNLRNDHQHGGQASSHTDFATRMWGCLVALGNCFSYAMWLIIQDKMSRRYPCHYSSTALMTTMACIQSTVIALCLERNWSEWKLGFSIRLLAASYMGIVTSGLVVILIAWTVQRRGPLFVSIFTPLSLVIVAIVGFLMLDENLHVGSIVGGVVIVCGLYMVLWGKSKEMTEEKEAESTEMIVKSSSVNNNITGSAADSHSTLNVVVDKDSSSSKENEPTKE